MSRRIPLRASLIAAAVALAIIPSAPALAQKAKQLSDLVDARAGQAENQLDARGYTYITGHASRGDSMLAYWWNGKARNCVRIETRDGRYQSIIDTAASDCNQKASSSSSDGKAAAAVIGVALLAAALSHKSDHHDNGQHYASQADEGQFDRGFNDGVHNMPFHNYDRTDAYASGYEAGVAQRDRNTSYHSGRGGYAAHAQINDLKNTDSISAIDTMSERGFQNVDEIESGDTQYGIFWNGSTRQCVQMTMADGRVYDIRELDSNPKCG